MSLMYALAASALLLLLVTVLASADESANRRIVTFRDGLRQGEMMATANNIAGAETIHDLTFINAVALRLSPEAEAALAANPNVLRIDDDPMVDWLSAVDGPVVASTGDQIVTWNVKRVGAIAAQRIADGEKTKMVVIDTGIYSQHPDLSVTGGKSFVDYANSWGDDHGHGTHVSGIIAAVNNEIGVLGVAPKTRLFAAKVLNFVGSGYLSDVVAGIDWAIKISAQVINMSLGTYADFPALHAAVRRAYRAGIAVVCAAGNSYGGMVIYPAAYPEAIAVSATDIRNGIAYFSSIGPEVDISAPGHVILSTYVDVPIKKPGYAEKSGTSMACPHVAGAVALIISSDPKRRWTPKLLKQLLQETATDLGDPGPDNTFGAGLLNANKAVRQK